MRNCAASRRRNGDRRGATNEATVARKDPIIVIVDRHQVPDAALAKATDDFATRLGGEVRGAMSAGRELNCWDLVTDTILGYVGARSVVDPEIALRDTREALRSAAATAIGTVRCGSPTGHRTRPRGGSRDHR